MRFICSKDKFCQDFFVLNFQVEAPRWRLRVYGPTETLLLWLWKILLLCDDIGVRIETRALLKLGVTPATLRSYRWQGSIVWKVELSESKSSQSPIRAWNFSLAALAASAKSAQRAWSTLVFLTSCLKQRHEASSVCSQTATWHSLANVRVETVERRGFFASMSREGQLSQGEDCDMTQPQRCKTQQSERTSDT